MYEHDIDKVEVWGRRDPTANKQAIGSAGDRHGACRGDTAATEDRRHRQRGAAGEAAAQAHQVEGRQSLTGDTTRRDNVSGCARSAASAVISARPAAFGGGKAEHPARQPCGRVRRGLGRGAGHHRQGDRQWRCGVLGRTRSAAASAAYLDTQVPQGAQVSRRPAATEPAAGTALGG